MGIRPWRLVTGPGHGGDVCGIWIVAWLRGGETGEPEPGSSGPLDLGHHFSTLALKSSSLFLPHLSGSPVGASMADSLLPCILSFTETGVLLRVTSLI